MEKDKTVEENNEKKSEELDSTKDNDQVKADEVAEKKGKDVVKEEDKGEEDDPYAIKLKELEDKNKILEEENKKKDDMLRQKNGALSETRKENKDLKQKLEDKDPDDEEEDEEEEEKPEYIKKDEASDIVESKLRERDVKDALKEITDNPNERKLIEWHYRNTIKQTGDVEADIQNAQAIANASIVKEYKQNEREQRENESGMVGLTKGKSYSGGKSDPIKHDPIKRDAAKFLSNIGEEKAIGKL